MFLMLNGCFQVMSAGRLWHPTGLHPMEQPPFSTSSPFSEASMQSLHSICSDYIPQVGPTTRTKRPTKVIALILVFDLTQDGFEETLGKAELSSPPPWMKGKLDRIDSPTSSLASPASMERSRSPANDHDHLILPSTSQVCQRQTKIETEFPASNASPKVKHLGVIYQGGRSSRENSPMRDNRNPQVTQGSPGKELLKLSDSFATKFGLKEKEPLVKPQLHPMLYDSDTDSDCLERGIQSGVSTVSLNDLLEQGLEDVQTPGDEDDFSGDNFAFDGSDEEGVAQENACTQTSPQSSDTMTCSCESNKLPKPPHVRPNTLDLPVPQNQQHHSSCMHYSSSESDHDPRECDNSAKKSTEQECAVPKPNLQQARTLTQDSGINADCARGDEWSAKNGMTSIQEQRHVSSSSPDSAMQHSFSSTSSSGSDNQLALHKSPSASSHRDDGYSSNSAVSVTLADHPFHHLHLHQHAVPRGLNAHPDASHREKAQPRPSAKSKPYSARLNCHMELSAESLNGELLPQSTPSTEDKRVHSTPRQCRLHRSFSDSCLFKRHNFRLRRCLSLGHSVIPACQSESSPGRNSIQLNLVSPISNASSAAHRSPPSQHSQPMVGHELLASDYVYDLLFLYV